MMLFKLHKRLKGGGRGVVNIKIDMVCMLGHFFKKAIRAEVITRLGQVYGNSHGRGGSLFHELFLGQAGPFVVLPIAEKELCAHNAKLCGDGPSLGLLFHR